MNTISFLFLAMLSLLAVSSCPAQDSDALALVVSHSDAIVIATYVDGCLIWRSGGQYVEEDFKDVVILRGEPMPQTLSVGFSRRLEDDTTPHKPGQRFILFLKRGGPGLEWNLADRFFGCQPYTHGLEHGVSEAAKSG